MNKEELLKAIMKLPKEKTNIPITTMNSINVDDLISSVDRLNKVPTYDELLKENKKQKEVIDKSIDFIENGDLLYLATKNSIVYRNNIEIRAVADRLNDLLQILEDKEVE